MLMGSERYQILPPPPPPPPPNGQSLCLVSALFNPENHELHIQAMKARDDALSGSLESYSALCLQLSYILVLCDTTPSSAIFHRIPHQEVDYWKHHDTVSVLRLQQDPSMWIPFGQMAGFILKNALLRPPAFSDACVNFNNAAQHSTTSKLHLQPPLSDHMKQNLLHFAVRSSYKELRDVASTIIATMAVSSNKVQPALHIRSWSNLVPEFIQVLSQPTNNPAHVLDGTFSTLLKLMEDGPTEFTMEELDSLMPVLLQYLADENSLDSYKISALQIICSCLVANLMPNSLVLHFNSSYLQSLSFLTRHPSFRIRKWVCRSIVTLLELRTEYIKDHLQSVANFMLETTSLVKTTSPTDEEAEVALEACDFWLTYASLEDDVVTAEMHDIVISLLPQLVPVLVRNTIYPAEKQLELIQRNNTIEQPTKTFDTKQNKPIFHKNKVQHSNSSALTSSRRNGYDDYNQEDENDAFLDDLDDNADNDNNLNDDDDDGTNEWTLRKCAAASLDSLANVFGGDVMLPCLLPVLQNGLSNQDQWVQEASILAFGAVAEGCHDFIIALSSAVQSDVTKNYVDNNAVHHLMCQIHSFLLNILSINPTSENAITAVCLPQIQNISAWTIGQYASWAVEQVQNGTQQQLLQQITETFLVRMNDNLAVASCSKVQFACCSSFGVVVETAGDLMSPYLPIVYHNLVNGPLQKYSGKNLLTLFDLFGILADFCGTSIAEQNLPSVYVPPLLQLWTTLLQNDPTDRTMLPLMECLASIGVACTMNYQPYALQSFDNAMSLIEQITLLTSTTYLEHSTDNNENEEEVDPIICALDLLDGLVEGLGGNFGTLLQNSKRYGPQFLDVLLSMCRHTMSGVRMSALAILGDLARHLPSLLEPAIPSLLTEAIACMDPVNPSVAMNAVWSVGEVCAKCQGTAAILDPFVPSIVQNLIAILMGNGVGDAEIGASKGRNSNIPGLAENASACMGRLAMVNTSFVADDLSRFLVGWCEGMGKISDPAERHDAYIGFVQAVYANPQAIQEAARLSSSNVSTVMLSIIFAIITWHIPSELAAAAAENGSSPASLFVGDYLFQPFPHNEAELGSALIMLLHDMKNSIDLETWATFEKRLPVNVRRLLREAYQL